eukprot:767393-Hanusia_phi.AAC.5
MGRLSHLRPQCRRWKCHDGDLNPTGREGYVGGISILPPDPPPPPLDPPPHPLDPPPPPLDPPPPPPSPPPPSPLPISFLPCSKHFHCRHHCRGGQNTH